MREPLPGQPAEPRTWHRYAYAFANPVNFYDPYGQQTCSFNLLTGERECFGERTGMGWTVSLPSTGILPPPSGSSNRLWEATPAHMPHGCEYLSQQPVGALCDPHYTLKQSVIQAWSLVREWFFEVGPTIRTFGPECALTQDIMHDPGIQAFQRAWKAAGYPVPWEWHHTADVRTGEWLPARLARGALVYAREHLLELPLSTGLGLLGVGPNDPRSPLDPVGGIIGSLDTIRVTPADQIGWVRIEVINQMDWRSGTRIPGTNRSLIDILVPPDVGIKRNWAPSWAPWLPIPGGETVQVFWWEEPLPQRIEGPVEN